MSHFDEALDRVLRHEGGFVDHPDDPGGATKYGITEMVARRYGYDGDMRNLPLDVAKSIYGDEYWLRAFDELPRIVALNVFDGAVNSGIGQSVRWLQRAVNVADDGEIGPITIAAVHDCDEFWLAMAYNSRRLEFMTRLSRWSGFGRGWARRIATNLRIT